MIDETIVNELMMWLTGGSAQMEANISQKQRMDGRGDEDVSDECCGV